MEARDLMTPGVISIVEDASLAQVHRALAAHRVHALLVVGRRSGRPLGWVTASGLLAWLDGDPALACASDAITEPATAIEPSASGREALTALGQPRVSRLLVQRHVEALPEGVISELDLIVGPRS
jgi:CBS domain-containing protein